MSTKNKNTLQQQTKQETHRSKSDKNDSDNMQNCSTPLGEFQLRKKNKPLGKLSSLEK